MHGSQQIRLIITSLIASLTLISNIQAAPILSTNENGTQISGDPHSGPTEPITSTPFAREGGSVDFSGPAYASATSTGDVGTLLTDEVFLSGQEMHELRTTSTFSETVTNSSGSKQNYLNDFNTAPAIEIDD